MNDKDKKSLALQKAREKRQNQKAKEKWDCVSVRLPKGSKAKIVERGESVNGLINRLVAEYLEQTEPKQTEPPF